MGTMCHVTAFYISGTVGKADCTQHVDPALHATQHKSLSQRYHKNQGPGVKQSEPENLDQSRAYWWYSGVVGVQQVYDMMRHIVLFWRRQELCETNIMYAQLQIF